MRISIKKCQLILMIAGLSLFMMACTPNEEVWTGDNKNHIRVVCGKSCQTILFSENSSYVSNKEKNKIRRFVNRRPNQRIFVSPCDSTTQHFEASYERSEEAREVAILTEERVNAVKKEVNRFGGHPVRLKPTLPAKLKTKNCVNLVRGNDLRLYVERCPNMVLDPSVQRYSSNFGCTTNYNLAQMIINPWNLLALPGDNGTEGDRVAIGIKNYREGKVSKLDMEGST